PALFSLHYSSLLKYFLSAEAKVDSVEAVVDSLVAFHWVVYPLDQVYYPEVAADLDPLVDFYLSDHLAYPFFPGPFCCLFYLGRSVCYLDSDPYYLDFDLFGYLHHSDPDCPDSDFAHYHAFA